MVSGTKLVSCITAAFPVHTGFQQQTLGPIDLALTKPDLQPPCLECLNNAAPVSHAPPRRPSRCGGCTTGGVNGHEASRSTPQTCSWTWQPCRKQHDTS
jgi:hypothetical protein